MDGRRTPAGGRRRRPHGGTAPSVHVAGFFFGIVMTRRRTFSSLGSNAPGSVEEPAMDRWFRGALLVPSQYLRLYLSVELCLLYLGLPLLLYTQRAALDGWIAPILL